MQRRQAFAALAVLFLSTVTVESEARGRRGGGRRSGGGSGGGCGSRGGAGYRKANGKCAGKNE